MSSRNCCVVECYNTERNSPHLKFYRFPGRNYQIDQKRRWIEAVRRMEGEKPWQPNQNTRICSLHFVGGKRSEIFNSPSYIPTIFPPVSKTSVTSAANTTRHKQNQNRNAARGNRNGKMSSSKIKKRVESVSNSCQTDPCDYVEENKPDANIFYCWNNDKNEASTQTNIHNVNVKIEIVYC